MIGLGCAFAGTAADGPAELSMGPVATTKKVLAPHGCLWLPTIRKMGMGPRLETGGSIEASKSVKIM